MGQKLRCAMVAALLVFLQLATLVRFVILADPNRIYAHMWGHTMMMRSGGAKWDPAKG